MWKVKECFDYFDNMSRYEEEENIYPWNNEQLNFDIISDISTNKEKKQDFERVSDETFPHETEINEATHENENVIHLVKKEKNYAQNKIKQKIKN